MKMTSKNKEQLLTLSQPFWTETPDHFSVHTPTFTCAMQVSHRFSFRAGPCCHLEWGNYILFIDCRVRKKVSKSKALKSDRNKIQLLNSIMLLIPQRFVLYFPDALCNSNSAWV